jgi:hypothetical protein
MFSTPVLRAPVRLVAKTFAIVWADGILWDRVGMKYTGFCLILLDSIDFLDFD